MCCECVSLVSSIPRQCVRWHRLRTKMLNTPHLSLFNFFVNRCKENLHVILAFSPIGDAFRNRLRKFPSLINCCTIDWFQAWPDDALGEL